MDPPMPDPTRRDGDEQTGEQSPDPATDDTVRMSRRELIDDLLARVSELRSDREAAERERMELRRARDLAEREREQLRTERDLALRRAETAEQQLAEVQARIHALEDSLRQRRGP
jgi:chromosome segregation ATPase